MDINTYQKEAIRTDLPDYTVVQQRIHENKDTLQKAIMGFMISSSTLDLMKKKVMYNADHLKLLKLDGELSKTLHEFPGDFVERVARDPLMSQLFHYTIGVITEANEMVVALAKASYGQLDVTNVGEEISDANWYMANIANRLNLSMEDLLTKNNAKLKARYPEKFTDENANVRDLEVERQILEGN